jgi:1-deoxy-D-xylulose-5-phosphate reductoisomerase
MKPMGLTLLGSTGTIGKNTLEVVALHPERYRVHALTAYRNLDELARQCQRFKPAFAVVDGHEDAQRLQTLLADLPTRVLFGREALSRVCRDEQVDAVMCGIVGIAGLEPTLAAAQAGKRILLANKEALVVSGAILMEAARQSGALLLPVDSEHNAVFQSLGNLDPHSDRLRGVNKIVLTASGGPFRTHPVEALETVTPEQACRHPNWVMGRKISVDSASMMNKALELIEACWLFGLPHEQVEVLVHPQSIIHALVYYQDGSVLAQLGCPDMRTPIAHALAWPERIESGAPQLDLAGLGRLEFEALDGQRFPAVALARQAMEQGGTAPALLNAANEVAVEAFLAGKISFPSISRLIARVLDQVVVVPALELEDVLEADRLGRERAWQALEGGAL